MMRFLVGKPERTEDLLHAPGERRTTRNDVPCVGERARGVHTVHVPEQTSDGTAGEQAVAASSVNLNGSLTSEGFSCSTDGSARGDHVVDDGHGFSSDVEVFCLMNDGVSIDSSFFKVRKLAADQLRYARRTVDGALVGRQNEIWVDG